MAYLKLWEGRYLVKLAPPPPIQFSLNVNVLRIIARLCSMKYSIPDTPNKYVPNMVYFINHCEFTIIRTVKITWQIALKSKWMVSAQTINGNLVLIRTHSRT